jgi:hypothetical protein
MVPPVIFKSWKPLASTLLLAAGLSSASAQSNDCATCSAASKPESGFWHNPSAPGSGFALRIYGSTIAGGYFGFDGQEQQWLTFSGTLQPVDQTYGWRVESDLYVASGTGCFGCMTVPGIAKVAGSLEIEFYGRTAGRFRAPAGEWVPLELFTFGIDAYAEFSPVAATPVPELEGPWVLVFTSPAAGHITARYYSQSAWAYGDGSRDDDVVGYLFAYSDSIPESEPMANLVCRIESNRPNCTISQLFDRFGNMIRPPAKFKLDLRDLSPVRFRGYGQDGATVEGFRIGVD